MATLRTFARVSCASAALLLAGCGDSTAPAAVASVTVTPTVDTLAVGDSVTLSATVQDARGHVLTGRAVTWATSDSAVATVSATGLVKAVAPNALAATITATSEGVHGVASIAVPPLPAAIVTALSPDSGPVVGGTSVTIRGSHLTSLTDIGFGGWSPVAYTWVSDTAVTMIIPAAVHPGPTDVTLFTATGVLTCAGCFRYTPVTVPDTLRYTNVATGAYHSCGIAAGGAANCWGFNGWGQLGNGSLSDDSLAHAVSGSHSFVALTAAGGNGCGLTGTGTAYCWGADFYGELGAGGPGPEICSDNVGQFPCSTLPLAVAGNHAWSSLSTGWAIGCALTADSAAYCWGDNSEGGLGVGGDTSSLATCTPGLCSRTPLTVAGGLKFTTLAVGVLHVCGLIGTGAAYCWGSNSAGQLGVGVGGAHDACVGDPCSRVPLAVAGGLAFTALRAGLVSTCGLATDGAWYCWGLNNYGQLGSGVNGPEQCPNSGGNSQCSSTPAKVTVGSFASVFPGLRHSCGLTAAGAAYCWGWNVAGQLGDGTDTSRTTAVAVLGGLSFASLSPYYYHTCGVSLGGVPYCWGNNADGELGDGTTILSAVPQLVLPPGTAIAAAISKTAAVRPRSRPAPSARAPAP